MSNIVRCPDCNKVSDKAEGDTYQCPFCGLFEFFACPVCRKNMIGLVECQCTPADFDGHFSNDETVLYEVERGILDAYNGPANDPALRQGYF